MAVCDICNAPGQGTRVGAEDMRQAVFVNGFDPFKLGLARAAADMAAVSGTSGAVG